MIDLILLVPFFTVISVSFIECSLAQGFNLSVRDKREQNKHSDVYICVGKFSCSFNTSLLGLEKMYCVIKTISEIINNENNLLQLQRKSEQQLLHRKHITAYRRVFTGLCQSQQSLNSIFKISGGCFCRSSLSVLLRSEKCSACFVYVAGL